MKKILFGLTICLILTCFFACAKKEGDLEVGEGEKVEQLGSMSGADLSSNLASENATSKVNLGSNGAQSSGLAGKSYRIFYGKIIFNDDSSFVIDEGAGASDSYRYEITEKGKLLYINIEAPASAANGESALKFAEKEYLLFYNDDVILFYNAKDSCHLGSIQVNSSKYEYTTLNKAILGTCEKTGEGDFAFASFEELTYSLNDRWLLADGGKNTLLGRDPDPRKGVEKSGEELQKAVERYLDPANDETTAKALKTHEEYLIWSSGYASYQNPELYTEYARPKKVRITVENPRTNAVKTYTYDLVDTPHPQVLHYDDLLVTYANKKFTISVEEVYPGTKYDEVCINSVVMYFGQK